jgi:Rrf2 family protein
MKFSTNSRYGLRAIIHIAKEKHICSVKEISEAEEIPAKYLEKIILKLSKAGFITATRGASGGYSLAKPASKISVDDIVQTLEKSTSSAPCIEHGYNCPRRKKCSTRSVWEKIDQSIHSTLRGITLEELIK